jgi:hypothetical protein
VQIKILKYYVNSNIIAIFTKKNKQLERCMLVLALMRFKNNTDRGATLGGREGGSGGIVWQKHGTFSEFRMKPNLEQRK